MKDVLVNCQNQIDLGLELSLTYLNCQPKDGVITDIIPLGSRYKGQIFIISNKCFKLQNAKTNGTYGSSSVSGSSDGSLVSFNSLSLLDLGFWSWDTEGMS